MITDCVDGIVSLLRTANTVMLDKLINADAITINEIQFAVQKYFSERGCPANDKNFLSALINNYDIDYGMSVNRIMYSLVEPYSKKFVWNENIMSAFIKLIDCGGKLASNEILKLPDDAFFYYIEKNVLAFDRNLLWGFARGSRSPKIEEYVITKLENEIVLISQTIFLMFAPICILNGKYIELIMHETYRRNLLDSLFVYLVSNQMSPSQILDTLFDEHIHECENKEVLIFFHVTLREDAKRSGLFRAIDLFKSDPCMSELYDDITRSEDECTVEHMTSTLSQMKNLMVLYTTQY